MRVAIGVALLCGLLAAPVAAQDEEQQQVPYRAKLSACFEAEDFVCAYDVLMEFGQANDFPDVAVSVEGGPTVFGTLLFAVIDRSKEALDLDTRRAMAEQAVAYAFDSQPEDGFASGPYLLLLAEICREQEDRNCVITAGRSVQVFWEQGVWYVDAIGDGEGENDIAARAQDIISYYEGITQ